MIPLLSEQARRWLAVAEGLPQDQIQARAVDAAKTGMLSFADALAIKAMADQVTSSNAGMGVPAPTNTVMGEAMQQLQSGIVGQSVPPSLAGDASNSGLAALAAAQPPAPPSDGIAGLDISPEMFDAPKNMAAGGIVALNEGGHLYYPGSRGEFYGVGATNSRYAVPWEESLLGQVVPTAKADAAPSGPTPMAEKFETLLRRGLTPGQMRALGYNPTYPAPPLAPPLAPAPAPSTSSVPSGDSAAASTLSAFSLTPTIDGIEAPSEADIRTGVDKSYKGVDAAMRRALNYFEDQQKSLAQEGAEDRRMAAAMAGFKMAEAAGRPGGTFLGSAAAGGAQYAEDINKSRKDLTDKKAGLEKAGLDLALAKAELDVKKDETTRARVDKTQERYDQRLRDAADAHYRSMTLLLQKGELDLNTQLAESNIELVRLSKIIADPNASPTERNEAIIVRDALIAAIDPLAAARIEAVKAGTQIDWLKAFGQDKRVVELYNDLAYAGPGTLKYAQIMAAINSIKREYIERGYGVPNGDSAGSPNRRVLDDKGELVPLVGSQ